MHSIDRLALEAKRCGWDLVDETADPATRTVTYRRYARGLASVSVYWAAGSGRLRKVFTGPDEVRGRYKLAEALRTMMSERTARMRAEG